MVTRIIGIPDSNGIIHISCGKDIIEITVETSSSPDTRARIGTGGTGVIYGSRKDGIDPFGRAYALSCSPIDGLQVSLYDNIISGITAQQADPSQPNPNGVILRNVGALNMHTLSALSTKIHNVLPGIGIAIDFNKEI